MAPGTVYAAGVTYGRYLAPHQPRLALMRFDRRGRHDTSFGTDGFYLRPTFGINFATRVALLNGGDVVLADTMLPAVTC